MHFSNDLQMKPKKTGMRRRKLMRAIKLVHHLKNNAVGQLTIYIPFISLGGRLRSGNLWEKVFGSPSFSPGGFKAGRSFEV